MVPAASRFLILWSVLYRIHKPKLRLYRAGIVSPPA